MRILIFLLLITAISCNQDKSSSSAPDLIITNAQLWSPTPLPKDANAISIKDGKILSLGGEEIVSTKNTNTKIIDARQAFVMPGWIEGHGHFSGLGRSLMNLNLLNTKSWDEILKKTVQKVQQTPKGEWISGRGWHQEKWTAAPDKNYFGYPSHQNLSELSPDHPIVLRHASGHALFANEKAMKIAGVNRETPDPVGGAVIKDENGDPIGVFEERAMALIMGPYQDYVDNLPKEEVENKWYRSIEYAEEECLKKGVTSFQDAGGYFDEIPRYKQLAESGELDLRLWTMVRHSARDMKGKLSGLKTVDAGNGYFTCNAIKSEIDGALGAFGAWLLQPYSDKAGFHGQNTTSLEEVKNIAQLAIDHNMQLCVHAIGDRANRMVVDLYEHMLDGDTTKRWRIEHAQHLDPVDIPRFKQNGIIASMQGIHCTSDAPFVVSRLGEKRSREGAYPWRSLLNAGVIVANGTDAPVEDVDPIPSFYASVTRKRADTGLEFFTEQKMTRQEALESYTLANAYAAFEEDKKGSLDVGKYADITIMSKNLLTCPDDEILDAKVLYTIVNGEVKYQAE